MSSYCLRFDSQAQWETTFQSLFSADVDVIGTIYKSDGNDGAVAIPGFHVNAQGEVPEAVLPYLVFPVQHYREFFGVPTGKLIEFVGDIGGVIYVDINGVRYGFE